MTCTCYCNCSDYFNHVHLCPSPTSVKLLPNQPPHSALMIYFLLHPCWGLIWTHQRIWSNASQTTSGSGLSYRITIGTWRSFMLLFSIVRWLDPQWHILMLSVNRITDGNLSSSDSVLGLRKIKHVGNHCSRQNRVTYMLVMKLISINKIMN